TASGGSIGYALQGRTARLTPAWTAQGGPRSQKDYAHWSPREIFICSKSPCPPPRKDDHPLDAVPHQTQRFGHHPRQQARPAHRWVDIRLRRAGDQNQLLNALKDALMVRQCAPTHRAQAARVQHTTCWLSLPIESPRSPPPRLLIDLPARGPGAVS